MLTFGMKKKTLFSVEKKILKSVDKSLGREYKENI